MLRVGAMSERKCKMYGAADLLSHRCLPISMLAARVIVVGGSAISSSSGAVPVAVRISASLVASTAVTAASVRHVIE